MGKKGGNRKAKKKQPDEAATRNLSPQAAAAPIAVQPKVENAGEATEHDSDQELVQMLTALAPLPLIQLEMILTEMLFPNGVAGDAEKWAANHALLEGLRSMYLRKAFDTPSYQDLLKRAAAPNFLPTRDELIDMFKLQRVPVESWKRADPLDQLARRKELTNQPEASISGWSFEDKLEAMGCAVWGRNAFNLCCEDTGRYEFLTQNFIDAITTYIEGRVLALGLGRDPIRGTLVEIGAGSGALSFFINQALEKRGNLLRCTATDPDHRPAPRQRVGVSAKDNVYPVEPLDYKEALKKYRPKIVLCSWMPMGQDWSAEVRKTESVVEYILVGEADFGACGHNVLTWGQHELEEGTRESSASSVVTKATEVAPYIRDNWERQDLDSISKWQMQRYDSDYYAGNSVTVAFRKNKSDAGDAADIFA